MVVAPSVGSGPIAPGTPLFNVPLELLVVNNQYALQANLTLPLSDYVLRTPQSVAAGSETRAAAEIEARAARLSAASPSQGSLLQLGARSPSRGRRRAVGRAGARSSSDRRSHFRGRTQLARRRDARRVAARPRRAAARTRAESAHRERRTTPGHDSRSAAQRPYEIGENLLAPLPDEGRQQSVQKLYQEALRKRLELRAFESGERSLVEQQRATRAGYYPRLDAFGNAYYANPNQRFFPQRDEWNATWDLGVQLTWTPNDAGTSSAAVAGLEARRARVSAQKAAFRDALRNEVTQSYHALRETEASLTTSERGLAAAEEAYRVRRELFSLGRATTVEIIDAETDVLRARLEMINARIEQRIARARLEHALGRDR